MICGAMVMEYDGLLVDYNGQPEKEYDPDYDGVLVDYRGLLKVIHIHLVLRKMFITIVWNDQQSFYLYHYPSCKFFFVYVKFQSIA